MVVRVYNIYACLLLVLFVGEVSLARERDRDSEKRPPWDEDRPDRPHRPPGGDRPNRPPFDGDRPNRPNRPPWDGERPDRTDITYITVYSKKDFRGQDWSTGVKRKGCSNIPGNMRGRASSVSFGTEGGSVRLWSRLDCDGTSVCVKDSRRAVCTNSLEECDFDNLAYSVSWCNGRGSRTDTNDDVTTTIPETHHAHTHSSHDHTHSSHTHN